MSTTRTTVHLGSQVGAMHTRYEIDSYKTFIGIDAIYSPPATSGMAHGLVVANISVSEAEQLITGLRKAIREVKDHQEKELSH